MQTRGCCLAAIAVASAVSGFAQTSSAQTITPAEEEMAVSEASLEDEDLIGMSLEELLSVEIETASKKSEPIFDSPLSSTVITREEIRRSGVRTIMEALRLAPGIIVREQTVGNYDIHIRGLDNVPPHRALRDFTSMTILVMIDYRVVYNYFQGGTFWETLPIDLHDVDRIEVIRGPVAAMYGPNAVTGVINIITSKPEETGFYTRDRVEYSPLGDERIAGVSVGYRWDNMSAVLSGNYHHADRTQTTYYSFRTGTWYDEPADIHGALSGNPLPESYTRYPRLDLATDRFGLNGFWNFQPNEKIKVDVSGGYQNSRSQKIYLDNLLTPLTTNDSQTLYADGRAEIFGTALHVSYLGGHQMTPRGTISPDHPDKDLNDYRLHVLDANLEYDWSLFDDKVSLRPGVSYRRAQYDSIILAEKDEDFDPKTSGAAFQAFAASLRAEYNPTSKLRLIGALRLDHYPDRTEKRYYPRTQENLDPTVTPQPETIHGKKNYLSFQLSSSYKINVDNLVRISYSRAHRAPFLVDTYLDDVYTSPTLKYGNRALELMTTDALELGYRARLSKEIFADLEIFGSYNRNFSEIYLHAISYQPSVAFYFQYDDLETSAWQTGATASLALMREKLQAKVFATISETQIYNHAPDTAHFFDYEHDPNANENQVDMRHVGTPDLYGGFYLNVIPIEKLSINLSGYYYTGHTQIRNDSTIGIMKDAEYQPAKYDVLGKLILGAKVSYNVWGDLELYASGHNLLALERPEFAWADQTKFAVLLGADYGY